MKYREFLEYPFSCQLSHRQLLNDVNNIISMGSVFLYVCICTCACLFCLISLALSCLWYILSLHFKQKNKCKFCLSYEFFCKLLNVFNYFLFVLFIFFIFSTFRWEPLQCTRSASCVLSSSYSNGPIWSSNWISGSYWKTTGSCCSHCDSAQWTSSARSSIKCAGSFMWVCANLLDKMLTHTVFKLMNNNQIIFLLWGDWRFFELLIFVTLEEGI